MQQQFVVYNGCQRTSFKAAARRSFSCIAAFSVSLPLAIAACSRSSVAFNFSSRAVLSMCSASAIASASSHRCDSCSRR